MPKLTQEPDLSAWYGQDEVCRMLRMSRRWLNSQLQDGEIVIERRKRPRQGFAFQSPRRNKYEPCYNPVDVDRIADQREPKPTVFAGIEPKQSKEEQITFLLEQVLRILERRQAALDRGPWLTIAEAAQESRLRPIIIRRIVARMMTERSQDVFLDGKVPKIRRAALGELRADDLAAGDPADAEINGGSRPSQLFAAG